jgi:small subunit ribosomal protein S2
MSLPDFTMRELIDAGVHFGHKTKRWNPVMAPFLYGVRNDVHIIDLQQTVPLLHRALNAVRNTVLRNGRVLFVGTKRQASEPIAEAAKRCGQYYVNSRWLGGMLTNWSTIQNSIKQLRKIEELLAEDDSGLTKKEKLTMQRQHEKLDRSLGGIRDMGGLPDLIFVIDTNREDLAIKEAQKLGIPIVAIIDSNSSPKGIDYPIPGNDDATRAIKLYCKLLSDAMLSGLQENEGREEESRPAKDTRGGKQKSAAKSTTKKEAFAEEAKKAANKKSA